MEDPVSLAELLAPFHLVWSTDGTFLGASNSLKRFWKINANEPLHPDQIWLRRPFEQVLQPVWLEELTQLAIHISYGQHSERVIRGEVIPHNGQWYLIGSPNVSSIAELDRLGLSLSDLPIHHATGDHLIAIEANQASLSESQNRAQRLAEVVHELQSINHVLSGLVPDSMAQKLGLEGLGEWDVQGRATAVGQFIHRLQEALEFRESFLANMSHELRTPLNSILGISEVMLDGIYGPLSDKQEEMLGTVERSGEHLLSLINDILDLAKIEAGEETLRLSEVALRKTCEVAVKMSQSLVHSPQVSLSLDYRSKREVVWADQRRIRQLLLNLMGNAAKFTDDGTITLLVEDADDDSNLLIHVQDSGIGISPKDQKRLFEAFYQVDQGLARKHQGTGLGLAISNRIAQLHGGQLSVQSEEGKGSTFTLTMPVQGNQAGVPTLLEQMTANEIGFHQRPTNGESDTGSHHEFGPCHIMILDPDSVHRDVIVDYLHTHDYCSTGLSSGGEALESLLKVPADLILMDSELIGIDAKSLIHCLKGIPDTASIPIVVVSSRVLAADLDEFLAAGAAQVLSKPYKMKQLHECINAVLESMENEVSP